MSRPDLRECLYSAKVFLAAMLALYLALSLPLQNPYWSVATVYVVSHPLSGATRSKAIYRAVGTLIGAAASVLLVPALVASSVLLSLAVATWVGALLYLALLDRTPRGYVFMLAAYTVPLISFPSALHPEQIFDTALARSEEILLGIVCASLVNTLIAPQRIGPLLGRRMQQLLNDGGAWVAALFDPAHERTAVEKIRHRLLADVAALDAMIRQLSYDADHRSQVEHARQMRLHMIMLVPQATAVADALRELRQRGAAAPVAGLADEVCAWMAQGSADQAQALQARLQAALAAQAGTDQARLLSRHALTALSHWVDLWADCLRLHQAYAGHGGAPMPALAYRTRRLSDTIRHYDHGLLLFAAGSATAATFLASLLWIALGWDLGVTAVILIAVCSCFFAAADDPVPSLNTFLTWTIVSSVFALIYLFAVLPRISSFPGLVAVLALPLLFAGAFTARPQYSMVVMLFTAQGISNLGLQQAYVADFETFADSSLGAVLGVVFVLVWSAVTKPFGSEWLARRLARAGWRDLAQLAASRSGVDRIAVASRMVDRVTQQLPRIALIRDPAMTGLDVVADLRVCWSLLDLEATQAALQPASAQALQPVFAQLAAHYRQRAATGQALPAPAALRPQMLAASQTLMAQEQAPDQQAAQTLTGLQLTLFAGGDDDDGCERTGVALHAGAGSVV